MTRKRPQDMPPDAERLTTYQFELLSVVFVKGHSPDGDPMPVIWSPTKLAGKTLTRAEASTLSTRLKTLIQRGFIKRYGNELFVTEWGRYALWVYASKNQNEDLTTRIVLTSLNILAAKEEVKAFQKVLDVMRTRPLPPEHSGTIMYALGNALFVSINNEHTAYNEFMEIREKLKSEREGS